MYEVLGSMPSIAKRKGRKKTTTKKIIELYMWNEHRHVCICTLYINEIHFIKQR
jgi:hypothetical protein